MTDASVGDFLSRLAGKLDAAGVPHMVVGSLASSYHGVPRSSQDLDLVVNPDPGHCNDSWPTCPLNSITQMQMLLARRSGLAGSSMSST
jgi:hypothetical protein